jgi:hypothetical protein
MAARAWTASDPRPTDWPTVVGPDGVTWNVEVEDGFRTYFAQTITHQPSSKLVVMGACAMDWRDIFDEYEEGAVLREATADEADTWTETWKAGRS